MAVGLSHYNPSQLRTSGSSRKTGGYNRERGDDASLSRNMVKEETVNAPGEEKKGHTQRQRKKRQLAILL